MIQSMYEEVIYSKPERIGLVWRGAFILMLTGTHGQSSFSVELQSGSQLAGPFTLVQMREHRAFFHLLLPGIPIVGISSY